MLRRLCAWCGKELKPKPGPDGITHSICPTCHGKILADLSPATGEGPPSNSDPQSN